MTMNNSSKDSSIIWTTERPGQSYARIDGELYLVTRLSDGTWAAGADDEERLAITRTEEGARTVCRSHAIARRHDEALNETTVKISIEALDPALIAYYEATGKREAPNTIALIAALKVLGIEVE